MEVLEAIRTRRAVRAFAPRRVDDTTIGAPLERASDHPEAARYAPILHDPGFNIFYDAVAPVIVGYPSAPLGPVARRSPRVASWLR